MPRYSFPSAKTGKVMKSKVFDVPGTYTWTVPNGVTEVYLTGCGAGGGGGNWDGGNNYLDGENGGSTHFGSLLVLGGGYGPTPGYIRGKGNGFGGDGSEAQNYNSASNKSGGTGGSGYTSGPTGGYGLGLGSSGGVGAGGAGSNSGAGGGAGDYRQDYPVTVIPGQNITVTIGTGGKGGIGAYIAGDGGNGLLIVKWNE